MAKVSMDELYRLSREGWGAEPSEVAIKLAEEGASKEDILKELRKKDPVALGKHVEFYRSLGWDTSEEEIRAGRTAIASGIEEAEEVVPFEESVIARRAMDNAEIEAKAYEDYYSVLLAEHNGDYDRMAEELKQDYIAAVQQDNTERVLFLERIGQDLEDNKNVLGKQAELLTTQGVEALGLSDSYRERKEGEIREDFDTGVLRVGDDLEYMEEKLGVSGTRLVEDYERARAYGDTDRVRELEAITDKYRVKMEDLGKRHATAHTWRSGQRLVDVERMLRAQGRETEGALAQIERPIETARIAAERGGIDVAREIGRAQEMAGRQTEDLQAGMERDIADLASAGARERLTLKQQLQDKAAAIQRELGAEASPILSAMNERLSGAGLEPIAIGAPPTEGAAITEARREREDIGRVFERQYGAVSPEELIRAPERALEAVTPAERGVLGRELVRGAGEYGRERERGGREIEFERRLGVERALTSGLESGRREYGRRLEPGMVSPERVEETEEQKKRYREKYAHR